MSAKAEAEAAAALRELGATMKASTNAPKLHTLKLLNELGLDEEEDELHRGVPVEPRRACAVRCSSARGATHGMAVQRCLGSFVTLVGGEQHVTAALCFKSQMERVDTTCPVHIAIADHIEGSVPNATIDQLRRSYGANHIIRTSGLAATAAQTQPPSPWSAYRGRRLLKGTTGKILCMVKLLLWALPPERFPLVAFIDLDVLVLQNLDQLLMDKYVLTPPKAIAAAPITTGCGSVPFNTFFNSGVIVFRPSLTDLHKLLLTAHYTNYPWKGYFPRPRSVSWADKCSPRDDVYLFHRLFNSSKTAFHDCRLYHNGSLTGRMDMACEPSFADQSIMNHVFKRNWTRLDTRFNVVARNLSGCHFVANASEESMSAAPELPAAPTKSSLERAESIEQRYSSMSCMGQRTAILHLVGEPKPWDVHHRRQFFSNHSIGATTPTIGSARMLYRQRCGL